MAPIFTSFFFLTKKIFIEAIPLFVIALCLTSCGPQIYTTYYGNLKQFEFPNPKNCQTKGGIDICIEKVLDVEYEKPIYKQNFKVIEEYYPLLSTQKALRAKEIDLTVDFYEDTQPFKVILSNNTDHIISFESSRVALISEGTADEPLNPISKEELASDEIDNNLPVASKLRASIYSSYPNTDLEVIQKQVKTALISISRQAKLIHFRTTEILPQAKASGILLFPITSVNISPGKISFIDVITKSDKAANTIEKVRFDFDAKVLETFWKSNPNDTKKLVQINKEEFSKGKITPEKYTWDKAQKKWVKM